MKAWNDGDLADLEALESPDVVYHLPGLDLTGWDAHKGYILDSRPAISSLEQDWKYLSGEGSHIVLSYKSTAVMTAADAAAPMKVVSDFLFVFRLEEGRVAEVWTNGTSTNTPAESE